jgi:hypothetical protein
LGLSVLGPDIVASKEGPATAFRCEGRKAMVRN